MKYRYIFFGAGVIFLILAIVEFVRTSNYTAIGVNAVTAVIFLLLGVSPPQRPQR